MSEGLAVSVLTARQQAAIRASGWPALRLPEMRLPRTVTAHIMTALPVLLAVWAASLLFVFSYLGLGVPAAAAGFLAVDGAGLLGAAATTVPR